jgi:hypothetical protein
MTEADLTCLKSNVDKLVEIETINGERLTAKVISVFDGEDNADVFYHLILSSKPELYTRQSEACGYSLPLDEIISVKPALS